MTWAVLCDFDHTVTTEDVTDTLLEQHALPEWRRIEALWEQGYLGSRACMQQQIALVRATTEQVDAVADSIHIDPYFKNFASYCENHDVPLIIVSDGLDYVIKRILKRHGLDHLRIVAGHMQHTSEDRWELTSPFANAGCTSQASTCKCAMSRQIRDLTNAEHICYIGDGRSDYCVSREDADFVIAKDSLLTYCEQQQLPHIAFNNFALVPRILGNLIRHEPEQQQPAATKEPLYA